MPILLLLLVFCFFCGAPSPARALDAEDSPRLLGLGAVVSGQPYHGLGVRVLPVPFVNWDLGRFYVHGAEAGYVFWERGGLRLSAVGQPRFMGYHSSDSDALAGMEDRDISLDGGLAAVWDVPGAPGWSLKARLVNDLLSRHDGREAELAAAREFRSDYGRLRLTAGVRVQSRQLTGYYYGVSSGEARAGRAAYQPGTATDPFAGVMLVSGFSKEWLVILRAEAERLDRDVRRSPLVEDAAVFSGGLGVVRRF